MKKVAITGVIIIAIIAGIGLYITKLNGDVAYNRNRAMTLEAKNSDLTSRIAEAEVLSAEKVESLKNKLIDDLGVCETLGVAEPDATIILDSNNEMSIGNYMFQIKTVQHYVQKFENRKISRVDAIRIAIDHDKAKELTKRILFTEKQGYKNWFNCAGKLGLSGKISLVNSIQ
jgi:hypothetical protein